MKYQIIAKGAIYYVTIAAVIFPGVKITCYFHMSEWEDIMFSRESSPDILLVFNI